MNKETPLIPELAAMCKRCGSKYNYCDEHKCEEKTDQPDELPPDDILLDMIGAAMDDARFDGTGQCTAVLNVLRPYLRQPEREAVTPPDEPTAAMIIAALEESLRVRKDTGIDDLQPDMPGGVAALTVRRVWKAMMESWRADQNNGREYRNAASDPKTP